MECVWTIIGIVTPLLIGIGLALMSLPNATATEFLAARLCFILSVAILTGATLLWELKTEFPIYSKVIVGCVVGILVFVLFPLSIQWVNGRQYSTVSPAATEPSKPQTISELFQGDFPSSLKHILEKEFVDGQRGN